MHRDPLLTILALSVNDRLPNLPKTIPRILGFSVYDPLPNLPELSPEWITQSRNMLRR